MANNYRQASFQVLCTQSEFDALGRALLKAYDAEEIPGSIVEEIDGRADYETVTDADGNDHLDVPETDNLAQSIVSCRLENDGLWIYGEENFNAEGAAFVTCELLKLQSAAGALAPGAEVVFSFSDTCSKLRINEFGGGACVVTAEDYVFSYCDDDESLALMRADLKSNIGARLLERLAPNGTEDLFDELVHEAKAQEASDLNNAGSAAQVGYLLASGYADVARVRAMISNRAQGI